MQLNQINFPVYKLGKSAPVVHDGIAFYMHVKDRDDGPPLEVYLLVDDKNLSGNSLALRRLQLQKQGVRLYRLTKAVFFIADMLKLSVGATWFIDSSGTIFEYKKSRSVKLVFKKIKKVIPIKTGGALIEVEGLEHRFKTLFMPRLEERYAGLLKINPGYILYGLYDKLYPQTVRMI